MSQEPKKRHSRQRQGKRRASIHYTMPSATICSNCGNTTMPHIVCNACGYYKGSPMVEPRQKKARTA